MLTPTEIVDRARGAASGAQGPQHAGESGPSPRRPPRVPFALLVTGLIIGSLAALLALNTASAANELRRHGLVEKDNAVAARVQDLRVRVAASAAPGNLAKAAGELGMVPAGNPAFVVIGADGKAVVMGKPKAVTAPPVPQPKPKPKPKPTRSSASPTTPVARPSGTTGRTRTPTVSGSRTGSSPAPRPTTPTTTPTPDVTLPGGER